MNNYDYPVGADNSSAPWNESSNPPKEIEVTISMCISKTVTIKVTDYEATKEDDAIEYDFSECDIYQAVKDQHKLPNIEDGYINEPNINGWYIDELNVELE